MNAPAVDEADRLGVAARGGLGSRLAVLQRPEFAFPFMVWLGARIALGVVSWIGLAIDDTMRAAFRVRELFVGVPPLDGLCRWDCEHFLAVATAGYTNGPQTNFFPLLPMLSHALWFVTRIPVHWALLIVANAACLAAYVVLYRMFRRLSGDERVARMGLGLFAAYPFAFFHAGGYPESLMVLTTALALDYATRAKHGRAGLVLAVGGLSRHLALLAGFGLLAAQIQQRPQIGRFFKNRALLALGLPVLSLTGFCLYQQLVWGDFLAFYHARANWGVLATWGITDHARVWLAEPLDEAQTIISSYLPFAAVVTAGLLVCFRWKQAWAPAAFGVALMGLAWAIGLWGIGRYSASCWPAFLGLGLVLAKRPTLGMTLIGIFAVCQGLFFFLFSHQYVVL